MRLFDEKGNWAGPAPIGCLVFLAVLFVIGPALGLLYVFVISKLLGSDPDPRRVTGLAQLGLVVFFAAVSAWAVRREMIVRQRKQRGRLNRCLACGYDLRHSPRQCPECGRTVPRAPSSD